MNGATQGTMPKERDDDKTKILQFLPLKTTPRTLKSVIERHPPETRNQIPKTCYLCPLQKKKE